MKDDKYILINGWMVNELKLKGTTLLIYAIIHGFSRDGQSKFNGSLRYLCESTNTSKNTVIKSLKELVESGLITKQGDVVNNIQFNKYFTNERVVQKMNNQSENSTTGGSESEPDGGSESEHNNTIINNTILKENTSLFPGEKIEPISNQILYYLNDKKPSKIPFKPTRSNLKEIEARIKEKYKMKDFIAVIDLKISQWKDSDKMKKYIRPATLFGEKFGSYLDETTHEKSNSDGSNNFKYQPQENAEML